MILRRILYGVSLTLIGVVCIATLLQDAGLIHIYQ